MQIYVLKIGTVTYILIILLMTFEIVKRFLTTQASV